MKKLILGLILLALVCSPAAAETSVWKAQKGASVLYLGGTYHLLRATDFPLPAEFDRAYRAADTLVFETDIGQLNQPQMQQRLMAKMAYANGATIADYLTPATFQRLNAQCAASGLPMAKMQQFRPSLIALTLELVELTKIGVTPTGPDVYLYQKGVQEHKRIATLESVDAQIAFFSAMGEGYEDAYIAYALQELRNVQQQYTALVGAWRRGDVTQLDAMVLGEMQKKMPIVYKELLLDRNKAWLPAIDAFAQSPQKEFILVGVGHLIGPDGILAALQQKGYTVSKL